MIGWTNANLIYAEIEVPAKTLIEYEINKSYPDFAAITWPKKYADMNLVFRPEFTSITPLEWTKMK